MSINVTPRMNLAFITPEEEELLAIFFNRYFNLYNL